MKRRGPAGGVLKVRTNGSRQQLRVTLSADARSSEHGCPVSRCSYLAAYHFKTARTTAVHRSIFRRHAYSTPAFLSCIS